MPNIISRDSKTLANTILELEGLVEHYRGPGPRDADTITEIVKLLARHGAIAAAERIGAGYGLHVVK